jgi:hypothetical protein
MAAWHARVKKSEATSSRSAAGAGPQRELRHLLPVMPLASVSLGIISFTAQLTVWPLEAFYVQDDTMAVVETLTAEIKVTQPREVTDYAKAFAGLASMAVYGDGAVPSSRQRSTPWSELPQLPAISLRARWRLP